MPAGFSGFRRPNSQRLSTFLGERHEGAMILGWITSVCPQENWMAATKLGFLYRNNNPKPK